MEEPKVREGSLILHLRQRLRETQEKLMDAESRLEFASCPVGPSQFAEFRYQDTQGGDSQEIIMVRKSEIVCFGVSEPNETWIEFTSGIRRYVDGTLAEVEEKLR